MIEYLEGLLEQKGQEKKVLEIAETLLGRRDNSPRDILAIQAAILRSHVSAGQHEVALTPGQAAHELSKELGECDYFGVICLFLGTAYGMLAEYESACRYLEEYTDNISLYDSALRFQTVVWYNLGVFKLAQNKHLEASAAFERAFEASSPLKNDRYEHGIRQALVFQYLRTRELGRVPRLLAICGYYLRHHVEPQNVNSRLFHLESKTNLALITYRPHRAIAHALAGLKESAEDLRHMATLHLLVAKIHWEEQRVDSALGHAFTARYCAKRSNRSDLETEAVRFLSEVAILVPEKTEMVQKELGS